MPPAKLWLYSISLPLVNRKLTVCPNYSQRHGKMERVPGSTVHIFYCLKLNISLTPVWGISKDERLANPDHGQCTTQALPPRLQTPGGGRPCTSAKETAPLPLHLSSCSSSGAPSVCFQRLPVQPKAKQFHLY